MRQFRISTPTSSITNFTSKIPSSKKKERLSTSTNSNADTAKRKPIITSANVSPTVEKLKKTRIRTANNSVSPEQAAVVVKDYILPLFRLEKESKHIRRRTDSYAPKGKSAEFKEVGMVSDFKLIEDLYNKIEELKKQEELKEKELKVARQDREIYEKDFKTLNEQFLNSESNLALLNFSLSQTLKDQQQEAFASVMIKEQFNKYKILYEKEIEASQQLSSLLEEEKAKNDKVKNVAVKLEHVNSLLVMQNDLLGEKLKGVMLSLESIIGKSNSELKVQEEFRVVSHMVKVLSEQALVEYKLAEEIKIENEEMEVMVKELNDITLGVQDRKDRFIKVLRERNSRVDFELKQAVLARDKFRTDCDEINKKYIGLQEEHVRLRKKFKKMKKVFDGDLFEEKYCENCQSTYVEADNFNWSCRRHASKFTEDVFWCCGQRDKDAAGCITSKHVPPEEHINEEFIDIVGTAFCSSCKDTGHVYMECPKDPNTRSHFDPSEELNRIKERKKTKVPNAESYAVKKRFFKIVIKRIKRYKTLEKINKAYLEKEHKELFSDIKKYKEEIGMQ